MAANDRLKIAYCKSAGALGVIHRLRQGHKNCQNHNDDLLLT